MTIYTIHDRGTKVPVFDAEQAERLSRAGFRVTAVTR